MGNGVAVAMSGGVDSSAAALLLQRAGYELLGITMRLFSNEEAGVVGDEEGTKPRKVLMTLEEFEAMLRDE